MLAKAAQQLGETLQNTSPDEIVQELRDLLARKTQLQDILHGEQCWLKLVVDLTKKLLLI